MLKTTVRSPVNDTYNKPARQTLTPEEAAAAIRIIDGSKRNAYYDVSSLEELNDTYRAWALMHPNPNVSLTMPEIPKNLKYPTMVMFQQLPSGKVGALFVGG